MRDRQEPKKTALQITNQFHSGGGMTYDLKCEGVRLTLLIAERANFDDPGDWRVEARGSITADRKVTVVGWGTTREDALRAMGRSWEASEAAMALRAFDWETVVTTLRAVRAL